MTNNQSLGEIPKKFLEQAKKQKRKIAIGIMRPIAETVESLRRASEFANLIVVGAKIPGFENLVEEDQDQASRVLIKLLKDGKVDGIVRGQVKDSFTLDEFHRQFSRQPLPSNRKVCPCVLSKLDYCFVVGTCSIYQGMTLEDKIFEAERLIRYLREEFKIEPKIGIMSSLRPTSHHGNYPELDRVADLNTKFCEYLVSKGLEAKEYYFEYETAVWEKCNLIFPATGLVGNAWLKALIYLGDWNMIACPYVDLGVIYEDGSRNEKDFFWHIVHAVAMANSDKK
ncbi:MAG: hypothetical protein PHS62_02040 [Patescibacteria group bacterium]|nr:hypothetical protein [Patescibacteria group bacterium]